MVSASQLQKKAMTVWLSIEGKISVPQHWKRGGKQSAKKTTRAVSLGLVCFRRSLNFLSQEVLGRTNRVRGRHVAAWVSGRLLKTMNMKTNARLVCEHRRQHRYQPIPKAAQQLQHISFVFLDPLPSYSHFCLSVCRNFLGSHVQPEPPDPPPPPQLTAMFARMSASEPLHRRSCLRAFERCALIAFVPDTSHNVPCSA